MKIYKRAFSVGLSFVLIVSPFLTACQFKATNATISNEDITDKPAMELMVQEKIEPIFADIDSIEHELLLVVSTLESKEIVQESEAEPEEEVRQVRDIEELKVKAEDSPIMYLTFDDGPSGATTPLLLDELSKRDAKVSFFVVGSSIERFKEIVRRAYMEGHTVANHTYNHPNLVNASDETIRNEVNRPNKLLYDLLGIENRLMRPPYGSTNDRVISVSDQIIVLWNVDPRDWQFRDADTVFNNIVKDAADGAIVVLHDTHHSTVVGAIRAIDYLIEQGYVFLSLEEAEMLEIVNYEEKQKIYSLKREIN